MLLLIISFWAGLVELILEASSKGTDEIFPLDTINPMGIVSIELERRGEGTTDKD